MDPKVFRLTWIMLLLLLPCAGWAQERHVQKSNQQWLQYHNETKFSGHWMSIFDAGYRWKEHFSQRSQYIVQLAARYRMAHNLHLALGLGHVGLYQATSISQIEFRPFQELQSKHHLGKTEVAHRLRVEERFLQKVVHGETIGGNKFNFRFRYNFSWNIPLFSWSPNHPDHQVSVNIADEIFINTGRDIIYNVFDRNRISIGTAVQLNKNLSVNISFNSQFATLNVPAEFIYTEISWLKFTHKIDLSKKGKIDLIAQPEG